MTSIANGELGSSVRSKLNSSLAITDALSVASGNLAVTASSATNPALTITQTGAGPAFLVEDSASPDSSPFVIETSGNVGIGTTTPLVQLHAAQGSSGIAPITSAIRQFFESSGPAGIQVASGGTTNPAYLILGSNGSAQATRLSSQIGYTQLSASGASDYMTFQTGGFVDRMLISSAGNVVVGTGEASATPVTNTLRGPNGSGTDIAGAALTIQGGRGTGTGAGGALLFSTAAAGTTR